MEKYIVFKDFENYEVSNLGNIRNLKTNRILKQTLNVNRGYYQVKLYKNNEQTTFTVHRLVALTHIENPNNFSEVDHIDRNRLNNNANNLRWTTRIMNLDNSMFGRSSFITFNKLTNMYLVYDSELQFYHNFNQINDAVNKFQLINNLELMQNATEFS